MDAVKHKYNFKARLETPTMKIDFDGSVRAVDLDTAMNAVKEMSARQFNTTSDQIQVKSLVKVRKRRT